MHRKVVAMPLFILCYLKKMVTGCLFLTWRPSQLLPFRDQEIFCLEDSSRAVKEACENLTFVFKILYKVSFEWTFFSSVLLDEFASCNPKSHKGVVFSSSLIKMKTSESIFSYSFRKISTFRKYSFFLWL